MIERSVDFNRVEKIRQVSRFVKSLLASRGIQDAFPVGIGPARRPHQNACRIESRGFLLRNHGYSKTSCSSLAERMTLPRSLSNPAAGAPNYAASVTERRN